RTDDNDSHQASSWGSTRFATSSRVSHARSDGPSVGAHMSKRGKNTSALYQMSGYEPYTQPPFWVRANCLGCTKSFGGAMATQTEFRRSAEPQAEWPLRADRRDPTFQAYWILRAAFIVAPILFGIDKFYNWMTFWPKYLWVGWPHFFGHVSSQHFMYAVGVVEILAGVLALLLPRYAPYLVAAWLAGIITNLVIYSWAEGGHT